VAYSYPSPAQAGIRIPAHLLADRFSAGFDHGLKGGQLDHVEYFRRSFRLGFRAANAPHDTLAARLNPAPLAVCV
jgi:hypothetical protein